MLIYWFYIVAAFYVTWGASADVQTGPGAPLPANGKALGKLAGGDFKAVVEKGILNYSTHLFLLAQSFK